MAFDPNDSDTKAAIKAAIESATSGLQDSIDKLEAKRNEALDEAKKAKTALRNSQEIKPEDLTAAESRAEKAEVALAEAAKAVKTLTTERDTAVKTLETEQGFTSKLLVDNGLTDALTTAGVKEAPHLKAVKAMLAPFVQIVADGDQRIAKVGDKALSDHIKEWAASEEGKFFVSAPSNGGGGAPGGQSGAQGAKTMTRTAFEGLDPGGRMAFAKDGGKVVDQAA